MLPTVRQLEFFVATAEAGQISRAAAIMNVTQSSITIAVGRLEELLGYALFHRRSYGMDLTEHGEVFLRHTYSILEALRESVDLKPTGMSEFCGTVRLAVTDTISGYFLPEAWKRLKDLHPLIQLEVTETTRPEIEAGLFDGEYDLGLALTSNLPHIDRYEVKIAHCSYRNLWVAANHPLAKQEIVSFADLSGENYALLTMDEHEATMRRVWSRFNFDPKILFRSQSIEAVRSIVARGMGITVLSDMVFRPWSLEGQRVIRKRLIDEIPTMDTGLFWPKDSELSGVVREAVNTLSFNVQ